MRSQIRQKEWTPSSYPKRMVQQREIYQWGWGSFEVRLGRRAHPGPGTQVDSMVADGQLEVCDGAYRIFVMKKSQRPRPSLRDRTAHPPAVSNIPFLHCGGPGVYDFGPGIYGFKSFVRPDGALYVTENKFISLDNVTPLSLPWRMSALASISTNAAIARLSVENTTLWSNTLC
jgi:hypothetical protein